VSATGNDVLSPAAIFRGELPCVINIRFMSNSWKMSAQVSEKVLETQFKQLVLVLSIQVNWYCRRTFGETWAQTM